MLNIIQFTFLMLAFLTSFIGFLINTFEDFVPVFLIKWFRYGSFAHKGPASPFLLEVPKSWFRHFYVFSSIFSTFALILMFVAYFVNHEVNYYVRKALELLLEVDKPAVSASSALVALTLLTIQCWKRFYETHYIQVFAKSGKINFSHYIAGLIHYFGCVVAVLGEAPLFSGPQKPVQLRWTPFYIPCILVFLWATYEQLQTNYIFSNLRKDKKSGELVTEEHRVPEGRLFRYVSSPHRLCEVIMYTVLMMLVRTSTFFCIYLWVISNQVETAIEAHNWYKTNFKSYPRNRRAIFPAIL